MLCIFQCIVIILRRKEKFYLNIGVLYTVRGSHLEISCTHYFDDQSQLKKYSLELEMIMFSCIPSLSNKMYTSHIH